MKDASRALLSSQLFVTLLLAAVLNISCGGSSRSSAVADSQPTIPVKLQPVEAGTIEESSKFVGTLEAQERVALKPEIEGRIVAIAVTSGGRVEEGETIVQLRPDRTQAQLESAIANINAVRSARATAQAELQAAEAERVKTEADLALQQVEFPRTELLVKEGAQSQNELDIARRNLDFAIATLRAAEDRVEAARSSFNQMNASLQQAEAEAAVANETLQYKRVYAPIAGIVGDFPVKLGDYVNIGQTLTTITQNEFLDLRISVPAHRSSQLRLDLPVELLDPNTKNRLAIGQLNFIAPEVDETAQTILVKARFPNPDKQLRDGQFVQARIIWSQSPGVLIPTISVSRIGGQNFVFVAEEADLPAEFQTTVYQRPVQLGDVQGDSYRVIEGVEAGENIAVSNILKLRDGVAIQPEF